MYLARDGVQGLGPVARHFDLFRTGIGPMAESGRLGGLARAVSAQLSTPQAPPSRDYLDWLLGGSRSPIRLAVESAASPGAMTRPPTQAMLLSLASAPAWVLIDEPKFESSVRQRLDLVPIAEAPIAYLRLHGRNAAAWWDHAEAEDRYNYSLFCRGAARRLRAACRSRGESNRKVLIYFNNHFSAKACGERLGAEARPRTDSFLGTTRREMVEQESGAQGRGKDDIL